MIKNWQRETEVQKSMRNPNAKVAKVIVSKINTTEMTNLCII